MIQTDNKSIDPAQRLKKSLDRNDAWEAVAEYAREAGFVEEAEILEECVEEWHEGESPDCFQTAESVIETLKLALESRNVSSS